MSDLFSVLPHDPIGLPFRDTCKQALALDLVLFPAQLLWHCEFANHVTDSVSHRFKFRPCHPMVSDSRINTCSLVMDEVIALCPWCG